jgi:hypothetical protein
MTTPYSEGTAQYNNSLAGLLRINDANLSDVEASDLIQPTDLIKILPFITSSRGSQHSWSVRTTAPGVSFRELNAGVTNLAAKEKTVTANLTLLDASFHRDKATLLNPKMTRDQYMQRESMISLNQALATLEYVFIRGATYAAGGFYGLADILDLWGNMGVDVGGEGGTRVYMLCLAEDKIAGVIGGNQPGTEGRVEVSEPYAVSVDDGTGKLFGAWRSDITGWFGLQIAGSYAGAVAFNIDGTSGKGVDDDLLAEMYSAFPTAFRGNVNAILMSRVGLKQLRDSMVTDLIPSPAFPTFWGGAGRQIPIVASDAINDAEAKNES